MCLHASANFAQVEYIDTARYSKSFSTRKPVIDSTQIEKRKFWKSWQKPQKPSISKPKVDSTKTTPRAKLDSLKPDSAQIKENIKKMKVFGIGGQITNEYQYGFIPYLMGNSAISGFYRSYGDIQIQTGPLPWVVSYHYSNIGPVSGLNNYIKVSFDADRYKEMIKQRKLSLFNLDSMQLKKFNLDQQKEGLMGRKYFLNSLLDINNLKDFNHAFSDTLSLPGLGLDSLKLPNLQTDSLSIDTAGQFAELQRRKQEVMQKIQQIDQGIQKIDQSIQEAQAAYDKATNFNVLNSIPGAPFNLDKVTSKIKKLDIGMSNPNLSPLFLNGTSLQGVHVELEDKHFLSITHGLTVAPVLFSVDPLQNQLQYTRNLFNFFDFGNVGQGQRITAIKGGYGTKSGTHFHVGILQGIGRTLLAYDATTLGNIEKNYVVELDAKLVINENQSLECFYDKSYFHQDPTEVISLSEGFKRIIKPDRTNASLVKHQIQIPKLKSKFTSTVRWIDPYFKNFGASFLRADNLRYEFMSDHQLSKKIGLTLKYRKDQDNLLNLYQYHNYLTSYGAQLKYKIFKGLSLVGGYFPIIHKIEDQMSVRWNKNYITNGVLTYVLQTKSTSHTYSLAYNHVLLSTDTVTNQYQTAQANYELGLRGGIRIFSSAQWFQYHRPDSASSETIISNLGTSFTVWKDMQITAKAKYSYVQTIHQGNWGYGLKISKKLRNYTAFELQGDKLITGDFYNSVTQNQNFGNFPYLFTVKLINNF